ncbi:DUF4114 domain-containing protein [Sediminicola luteus]|nr:DUF4114 domain-containing protein [Sediminicola luteus]
MRLILLFSAFFAISFSFAQNYSFLGEYTSDGTPLYFDGKDDVSDQTLQLIADALPEGYPVPEYNPHYISSGYDTDLILEEDADVWVTFVGEGAGYKNVLGFYTYSIDNPLTKAPKNKDITIIFPNVSALNSGGSLEVGHKVKIGRFEAGTGIGWVLLANGWKGKVTSGLWQLHSGTDFNPEADEALRYHNVLLNDPDNERIILGFEDIRRDYGSCDNDFNDALFYITANPFSAIKRNNYNKITDHTPVSSGNDGGLESNGDLASLIAKRNFDRSKKNTFKNKRSLQFKYDKKSYKSLGAKSGSLDDYFPPTGMFGNETPYVSSPEDLLGITNADKVFSIDYYQSDKRVSAALATETKDAVYNHTKTICDRLNGSTLLDLRTITLQGYQLIYSELERANGNVEYALVFSVMDHGNHQSLYSLWNIEEYPKGAYKNFQIWGNHMGQVSTLANSVINTLNKEKQLKQEVKDNILPTVFFKNGAYKNGQLHLEIVNKQNSKWLLLDGNYKTTEQNEYQNLNQVIDLNGDWEETLVIETGHLFDMGLSIIAENSYQHDAMYLADGPWGTDMNTAVDSLESFKITPHTPSTKKGHTVERGIIATGAVKETINVFRNLMAGDRQLPITTYKSIDLNLKNSQEIEVSLVTDATTDWNERLRLKIGSNTDETEINLPFSDFKNHEGKPVEFEKLRSIVFSIQGDYKNYSPFVLEVAGVVIVATNPDAQENEATGPTLFGDPLYPDDIEIKKAESDLDSLKLMNYPNPFTESTSIQLPEPTDKVWVMISHLNGQVLFSQVLNTNNDNHVNVNLNQLASGVYAYKLSDLSNGKSYGGKLIKE